MAQTEKGSLSSLETIKIEKIDTTNYHLIGNFKLIFVLTGSLRLFRSNQIITLETGDIYLLNPDDLVSFTGSSDNTTASLTIKSQKIEQNQWRFLLNQPLSRTYHQSTYEEIAKKLALMIVESYHKRTGYRYIVSGYVQEVIGILVRDLPKKDKNLLKKEDQEELKKITEIQEYIQRHYAESLNLSRIAELFFINKYYLAHLFKGTVGLSVGNYIKEIRLVNSINLLDTTKLPITEIALRNGFANVRSFNEAFKELNGVSPSQFRKLQEDSLILLENKLQKGDSVIQLLARFLPELVTPLESRGSVKKIEKQINLQALIKKRQPVNFFLKADVVASKVDLKTVCQPLGIRYVSVSRLLTKIAISQGSIDFSPLDHELAVILAAGLQPYIQLQAVDYQDYLTSPDQTSHSFQDILKQLALHLQGHYPESQSWVFECRVFTEGEGGSDCCQPLVDSLPFFYGIGKLLIHFPLQPESLLAPLIEEEPLVGTIDDRGLVKPIAFKVALANLQETKYLEMINLQKNVRLQQQILSNVISFEEDAYYQKFAALSQANQVLWLFLNQSVMTETYYSPISLEGSPLFYYFPAELSEKMALVNSVGLYQDNWHAHRFMASLYKDVVFHNEHLIVTKWQENYRILALYAQADTLEFFDQEKQEQPPNEKVPYLHLALELLGIEGEYKISHHEMTPELEKKRHNLNNYEDSNILSFEEIAYFNGINQPSRQIKSVIIEDKYLLTLELPLFGMKMVEMVKKC